MKVKQTFFQPKKILFKHGHREQVGMNRQEGRSKGRKEGRKEARKEAWKEGRKQGRRSAKKERNNVARKAKHTASQKE